MGDREILTGLRDVALASPLFAGAPLLRSWHLRWGATGFGFAPAATRLSRG